MSFEKKYVLVAVPRKVWADYYRGESSVKAVLERVGVFEVSPVELLSLMEEEEQPKKNEEEKE